MGDESKTNAEAKTNADQIKDVDATSTAPRGNVFSEKEESRQHDAPPPMPH